VISAVLVLIILALIVMTPFLISVLFGAQYLKAVLYTRILLCDSIMITLYTPLLYLLYADNKGQNVFILFAIVLAVVACALSLLVPRFGLTGAALSVVISSFCGLVFIAFNSVKIIRKRYGYA
jgi:O-antigen/teichoic acid export membrane protein